jgi:hypothetical protein
MGWTVLALALLGFAATRRSWTTQALGWLTLAGLLVALGPFSLLHGILYSLAPLMEKARSPAMAIALTNLGIAILAARGLDHATESPRTRLWIIRILLAAGGLIAIGVLVQAYASGVKQDQLMASALAAFAVAAILGFVPTARLAISALCLFELSTDSLNWAANQDNPPESSSLKQVERATELIQHLRTLPRHSRIEVNDQDVTFNLGGWYNLPQRNGYLASITRNQFVWDIPDHRRQQASAARFFVAREPSAPDFRKTYTDRQGISVWENPRAMPRSWIVHTVFPALDLDAGVAWWNSKLSFVDSAFVEGSAPKLPIAGSACKDEPPQVQEMHPARVVVTAELGCPGLLVLADTDYPGWRASVEGRAAPILAAYGVFRGVVLPAGKHRVEFKYQPVSVFAGFALTGAFSFATLLLWRSKL